MVRVFRPAVLSIIGSAGPFSLAWYFLTGPFSILVSVGAIPPVNRLIGYGAWVTGDVLLAFSIVLLVDQTRHRFWGATVAFLYAPASYIIIGFLYSLAASSDPVAFSIGVGGLTAQTVGVVGGLWGFFAGSSWRRRSTTWKQDVEPI